MPDLPDWQITILPEALNASAARPVVALFTCTALSVPWTYSGAIIRGRAGIAVSRVETASDLDMGLTLRSVRAFPVGAVLAEARAVLRPKLTAEAPAQEPVPCSCGCLPHRRKQSSGRYAAMSDEFLREIAMAFIEETGPGRDKAALQRMAVRYDRPHGTVRSWIARARREGWLASGTQGRVGADPGPRLLAERQPA